MKIIVSTRRLNGMRKNDIWEAPENQEFMAIPHKLALGEFADDDTGNARSFFGVETGKRNSTGEVRVVTGNEEYYAGQIQTWLMRQYPEMQINYKKKAWEIWDNIQRQLTSINPGTIVECRDLRITPRQVKSVMATA